MGYTHYFGQNRGATIEEWSAITADVKKLVEKGGVPLWSEYDEPGTAPVIDADQILFNGCAEDGHETFYLQRDLYPQFNFCKTVRKPYDLIVCGVLIIAEKHAPGAWDIGSDGSYGEGEWQSSEWTPAINKVAEILGDGYDVPPRVKAD